MDHDYHRWPSLVSHRTADSSSIHTISAEDTTMSSILHLDTTARWLQQNATTNSTGGPPSPAPPPENKDAYEFVAFLLWYIFLVLCCVIPTCCAYRRRRLLDARMREQQANLSRLQQSNLFIISNLHHARECEQLSEERARVFKDELAKTTMTVTAGDILDAKSEQANKETWRKWRVVSLHEEPDNDATTADAPDVEMADPEFSTLLRLKSSEVVSGVCAICLSDYEIGDQVSWSPMENCRHAFHSDCIVPWISKKTEPRCPHCRQVFCTEADIVVRTSSDFPSFGFGNTGFFSVDQNGRLIPVRDYDEAARNVRVEGEGRAATSSGIAAPTSGSDHAPSPEAAPATVAPLEVASGNDEGDSASRAAP